jgi:hypothetical protein
MAVTYTLGQMTDDTLIQMRGTTRDEVNILAASIDAPAPLTVETITLTGDLNGITVGSLLVVGDETIYVLNAYPANTTAQVIRGWDDTTPAVAASGAIVQVDPPFTRSVVQAALKSEIRSWAPQVFNVASTDISIVSLQRGYDMGNSVGTIIRVLYVTAPQPPYIGSPGFWDVSGSSNAVDISQENPSLAFRYDANANPVEFASGKSITLIGQRLPTVVGKLHVVYATPFNVDSSWTETTDVIATVGMDERDLDIPPLGACARLLRSMVTRRAMLNVQGQNREDQDVTMAAILQAAQKYQNDTKGRLSDAQQRLLSDWPYRSSNY